MFAPSQLNEIDDGIPVRSSGRGRGGTSPLRRFRLLGSGPHLAGVVGKSIGEASPALDDHNWPKGFWSQIKNRIPLPRGRGVLPLQGLLRRPRPGLAPRRPTHSAPSNYSKGSGNTSDIRFFSSERQKNAQHRQASPSEDLRAWRFVLPGVNLKIGLRMVLPRPLIR